MLHWCSSDLDLLSLCFFFFKQKTAYEIKECDWSSDVCSSDLPRIAAFTSLLVHQDGDATVDFLCQFSIAPAAEDGAGPRVGVEQLEIVRGEANVFALFLEVVHLVGEEDRKSVV